MKHVRSLLTEPPLLASYRANPAAGASRAASDAIEVWKRFKKRAPDAHRELLEELAKRQQGLCAYCEQRLVREDGVLIAERYQVEHVLPKSGGVGRVLDWTNLVLACWGVGSGAEDKSCGAAKGSCTLPAGCDPRTIPLLSPVVVVGTDGRVQADHASCGAAGVAAQDVEDTLTILNLDCERLRKPRRDAGNAARETLVKLIRELGANGAADSVLRQAVQDFVRARMSPDQRGLLPSFWSAERSAIGEPAEAWLAANQQQFT